jgi:hypothetical protein
VPEVPKPKVGERFAGAFGAGVCAFGATVSFGSQELAAPFPIAGLRSRIVHDCFGLDAEIIGRVINVSLPELKEHFALIRG